MMVGASHVSSTLVGCIIPADEVAFADHYKWMGWNFTGIGIARASWGSCLQHKNYLCLEQGQGPSREEVCGTTGNIRR